ncbi:hypothetical protein [Roseovarius sp. A-2]|uniref:hypothetical protein n=1 Tax=Roseovarius sp. A-2 TaxID=1570360 RepID=UPI001594D988|nr:hypothetical protein [Roseovarius sp. A-2]
MVHPGVIHATGHIVTGVIAVACMRVMPGTVILFGVPGAVIVACAVLRGVIMTCMVMAGVIGNRGRGNRQKGNSRQPEAGRAGNGLN